MVLPGMLIAIQFNHQTTLQTNEVNDVTANRVLATKVEIFKLMVAKKVPQFALGQGHLAPHSSCEGFQSRSTIVTTEHRCTAI